MTKGGIAVVGVALSILIASPAWATDALGEYPLDHIGSTAEVQAMLDAAVDRQRAVGPAPKISPSDEQTAEMVLTMLGGEDGKLSIEALESWTKEPIEEKAKRENLSAIYDKRAQAHQQALKAHCDLMMDPAVDDADAILAIHVSPEETNVSQTILAELKRALSPAAETELEKMIADVAQNMSVGDPEHQRSYFMEISNILRAIYKDKCSRGQQDILDGIVDYE